MHLNIWGNKKGIKASQTEAIGRCFFVPSGCDSDPDPGRPQQQHKYAYFTFVYLSELKIC